MGGDIKISQAHDSLSPPDAISEVGYCPNCKRDLAKSLQMCAFGGIVYCSRKCSNVVAELIRCLSCDTEFRSFHKKLQRLCKTCRKIASRDP